MHLIRLERNIVLEGDRAEARSPRTCLGEKQRHLGNSAGSARVDCSL